MSDRRRKIEVYIRWMIRRDMPEVLAIESESFEHPWPEEDFIRCLRQQNCIGMVAEHDDRVVGYMIYDLCKTRIHVFNFAVASDYRRHDVGTQMLNKLIGKLSRERRTRIVLEVRESNLSAQHFFLTNQFRAISVLQGYYEDTDEDAYIMQYLHKSVSLSQSLVSPSEVDSILEQNNNPNFTPIQEWSLKNDLDGEDPWGLWDDLTE